ncbi:mCG145126, partial [Mus musculus]
LFFQRTAAGPSSQEKAALNCLQLQLQEVGCPFMDSVGTCTQVDITHIADTHPENFKVSLSLYLLVERIPPFRSKAYIRSTQESYKSFSQANKKKLVKGSSVSALMDFVFKPLVYSANLLFTHSTELLQYSWSKWKCKGKYKICADFKRFQSTCFY